MRPGTARGKPIASNWSQDIVPLVSVRSTWSTAMPISSPASALPTTRWLSISFRVRLWPISLTGGERAPLLPQTPPPIRTVFSSFLERHPRAAPRPDVVAARPDESVVVVLLDDVRRPARDAAGGDHRREEVDGDSERVEERRRVEVDVRDELLRLVDARVELHRHLVPLELAGLAARVLGHPLEDRGARVARLVDAVAHAHEPALLGDRLLGEGVNPGDLTDLHQRPHDRLTGATVQRPLQRADATGNRRVHVGLRRDDHARREGGGVQLVLGVEREARVEGLGDNCAGPRAR